MRWRLGAAIALALCVNGMGLGAGSAQAAPATGRSAVSARSEHVRAPQREGRASPVRTPAAISTAAFPTAADTFVSATYPRYNFDYAELRVSGAPSHRTSYLKFNVHGLGGPVAGAKLLLHVWDVGYAKSVDGGAVRRVADTSWTDDSFYYFNRPAVGAVLGHLGPVARNQWYEVDVSAAVHGNGPVAFALTSTSTDAAYYDCRECGPDAPVLVVRTR